jgi:trehalose 6-phosphate phosphatase
LFTDYDGTLSGMAEDRAKAYPLPGARQALELLAQRLAVVAVVSGRPVEYLSSQVGGVPGLLLIGLYGLERSQDGRKQILPGAQAWLGAISSLARAAEREVPPGVEVESKGLTVALHARRRPDALDWLKHWSQQRALDSGLQLLTGRMSMEFLPPVAMDKGVVVDELASGLEAACFFGDDTGDFPAFAALGRLRAAGKRTAAVGVESPEQPDGLAGAVDLLVDSPQSAVALLSHLAAGDA